MKKTIRDVYEALERQNYEAWPVKGGFWLIGNNQNKFVTFDGARIMVGLRASKNREAKTETLNKE